MPVVNVPFVRRFTTLNVPAVVLPFARFTPSEVLAATVSEAGIFPPPTLITDTAPLVPDQFMSIRALDAEPPRRLNSPEPVAPPCPMFIQPLIVIVPPVMSTIPIVSFCSLPTSISFAVNVPPESL